MSDQVVVKKKVVKKTADSAKLKALKRVYLEDGQINSDFFVLHPSKMAKIVGIVPKGASIGDMAHDPTMVQWLDHQHFFYTYNPDGQEQLTSTHIGGHFHLVEIEHTDSDDEPVRVVSVSGPMKWARKRHGNGFKKVTVPAMDIDSHTHNIEYIKSDIIKRRKINAEVAKIQTVEASKLSSVSGIKG